MVNIIDLHFLQVPEAIAAYVVPTENGAVLIECGPHSTINQLVVGLDRLGLQPKDVHTLLLTHIHFDHAGAAWWLAEHGTHVYVHPRGHKHMLAPERLYESARMIYQDKMDELWGKMEPINSEKCSAVDDGEVLHLDGLTFTAHHTPGHAVHHIAWQLGDDLFTGDVAGVKIGDGPVVPPCPPPDVHVEDWRNSIDAMRKLSPARLYLTHYGLVDNANDHLDELSDYLTVYAEWMKPHFLAGTDPDKITPKFVEFVEADFRAKGLDAAAIASYNAANPPWMSVVGLLRYWRKHGEV